LDPVATNWYDPAFFALFESLLIDSPEGELQPQLATAWEVAEDGRRVSFTIREGAVFHSGRAVDAQAVKEVYDAIKDPANASPLAVLFAPVESIEAADERTLVLNLSHPYYEVLNVVKTGYWAIVNIDTRTASGEQFGQSQVDGTGPFLFQEWVPGSHVSVTKWADYPGSIVPYIQNKGPAYLDGIRWEAILEAAQRAVRIENGEIDTLRNPALQDVARLEGNPDLSVTTFSEPSGYLFGQNFERTDWTSTSRRCGRRSPTRSTARRSSRRSSSTSAARSTARSPRPTSTTRPRWSSSTSSTSTAPKGSSPNSAGPPAPTASWRRTASGWPSPSPSRRNRSTATLAR
jgi:peptide/nickel transport system substrate-binding protein